MLNNVMGSEAFKLHKEAKSAHTVSVTSRGVPE